MRSHRTTIAALALMATLAATPALADRIDGDWCDGARSVTINGPAIRTPANNTIQGRYGRHDFTYTIPAGESGAGGVVDMRLMNEEHANVTYGSEAPTVWRRCRVTS